MNNIDLQAGKINYKDQWLSVDDLAGRIQEKMNAGDLKFSDLAAALEELKNALENSHTIETRIVVPTADYEKLKALGKGDDLTCVREAIMAFIAEDTHNQTPPRAAQPEEKKKKAFKCAKCQAAIEIPADERPTEIECPECGTVGRLKPSNKT